MGRLRAGFLEAPRRSAPSPSGPVRKSSGQPIAWPIASAGLGFHSGGSAGRCAKTARVAMAFARKFLQ
eukprot:560551-Lingulodinium_polyedra.AAC.1